MQRKTTCLRRRHAVPAGLAIALLLAGTLLGTDGWRHLHNRLLAAYCEDGLTAADEQQVAAWLERLMNLRGPGMAVVVRAIGNPTATTREAAYRKLADELNRSESEPPSAATAARLSDLARSMADSIDDLAEPARQRVAVLAMKVLARCQELPLVDRDAAIAACDRVLASAKPEARSQSTRMVAPDHKRVTKNNAISQPPAAPKPVALPSELDLSRFSAPPLARADARGGMIVAEPQLFFAQDTAALAGKTQKPPPREHSPPITVAAYSADIPGARGDEEALDVARSEARELDIISLFTRLHDTRQRAASARAELEARGYSQRQIEVGQHLVSSDAEERLRWTEWLPGIRGIDARFWLLRLSRDPNAQVRRAAVGLLATDRDPEVVRRLQRVVIEEPDERVRDQASRLLEAASEP